MKVLGIKFERCELQPNVIGAWKFDMQKEYLETLNATKVNQIMISLDQLIVQFVNLKDEGSPKHNKVWKM